MKKLIHLMTKQVSLVYQTARNTSYECVYNPKAMPEQKNHSRKQKILRLNFQMLIEKMCDFSSLQ